MLLQKSKIYERETLSLISFSQKDFAIKVNNLLKDKDNLLKLIKNISLEYVFENNLENIIDCYIYENLVPVSSMLIYAVKYGRKKYVEELWEQHCGECYDLSDDEELPKNATRYLKLANSPEVINVFYEYTENDTCRELENYLNKEEPVMSILNFYIIFCCRREIVNFREKIEKIGIRLRYL